MKSIPPLLLSCLVVGSITACGKSTETTTSTAQSVPTGTQFEVAVPAEISTAKNKDQDPIVFPVKSPLVGGNPLLKGAKVEGHLENVVKAERGKKASLHLVFDEIAMKDGAVLPLDVALLDTKVETKTQGKFLKNVGIVLGGAAAGHFAGNKLGKKHGGVAGAAAATAFVLASPGGEVVLKKGTVLDLKLKAPIDLAKAGA